MKVTQKMIAEGWSKNEDGVWVAPSEATKQALKERVLLSEDRKNESLGPGWVRVPVPSAQADVQVASFKRLGLSEEEAKVAAGVSRPPLQNDTATRQWSESVKNFDARRGNRG
jgi:hypothetical protein